MHVWYPGGQGISGEGSAKYWTAQKRGKEPPQEHGEFGYQNKANDFDPYSESFAMERKFRNLSRAHANHLSHLNKAVL